MDRTALQARHRRSTLFNRLGWAGTIAMALLFILFFRFGTDLVLEGFIPSPTMPGGAVAAIPALAYADAPPEQLRGRNGFECAMLLEQRRTDRAQCMADYERSLRIDGIKWLGYLGFLMLMVITTAPMKRRHVYWMLLGAVLVALVMFPLGNESAYFHTQAELGQVELDFLRQWHEQRCPTPGVVPAEDVS
jgi:hypothetical protein